MLRCIMYTVQYYIGGIDYQKQFNDYLKAHEFALSHWVGLDSTTRDTYRCRGWNTCIEIEDFDKYDEPIVIVFE